MRQTSHRNSCRFLKVIVLLFLWLTQRDTVQAWLAYLTTATGVALGVFELFGLVSRPGIPKE